MNKKLSLLLILSLYTCTTRSRSGNKGSPEGQQWTWGKQDASTGIGGGNSWTFLANQRFTASSWYSGGTYWNRSYSGVYYYNPEEKTVFLKYNRDNAPPKLIKQQLQLIITETDTLLSVKDDWKRSENQKSKTSSDIQVSNFINEKSSFKMVYLKKKADL